MVIINKKLSGRLNRRRFFAAWFLGLFLAMAPYLVMPSLGKTIYELPPVQIIAALWTLASVGYIMIATVQRLHDFNASGWFVLIPIVIGILSGIGMKQISPLGGLFLLIIALIPGHKIENKYGSL
jgi:uncharacterized membrane protein YhaH (DUF805 family)